MIDFLARAQLAVGRCPLCTNEKLHTHDLPVSTILTMLGGQILSEDEVERIVREELQHDEVRRLMQEPDPEPEPESKKRLPPLAPNRALQVWAGGVGVLLLEVVFKLDWWSLYVRKSVRQYRKEQHRGRPDQAG